MSKKVTIGAKPTQEKQAASADQWVQKRSTEGMKRVTVDIPASLHKRIRIGCLMRGTNMADELRTLLEEHFKDTPLPK